MKTITLAQNTDGTYALVHGPDVPFTEQRQTVQGFRDGAVPEGVERVSIFALDRPVKFAFRKPDPSTGPEGEDEGSGDPDENPSAPPGGRKAKAKPTPPAA